MALRKEHIMGMRPKIWTNPNRIWMHPKKGIFSGLWNPFKYQYLVFLSNSTLLTVALRMVLYESRSTPRSLGASAAATRMDGLIMPSPSGKPEGPTA